MGVHLGVLAVDLGNPEAVPYPLEDSFQSDIYEARRIPRT